MVNLFWNLWQVPKLMSPKRWSISSCGVAFELSQALTSVMSLKQAPSAETLFFSSKCYDYRVCRVLKPMSTDVWLYIHFIVHLKPIQCYISIISQHCIPVYLNYLIEYQHIKIIIALQLNVKSHFFMKVNIWLFTYYFETFFYLHSENILDKIVLDKFLCHQRPMEIVSQQ